MMRTTFALALVAQIPVSVGRAQSDSGAAKDASRDRIETLLREMTLAEKLGQMTQQWGGQIQDNNPTVAQEQLASRLEQLRKGGIGSFLDAHGAEYTNGLQRIAVEESRLRIPLIIGYDSIHGYRTIFPIPLGEAASWDPATAERSASVSAAETRAAGIHWTFAPMVDICRDPRWGRIAEGAGEDPYLGSVFAAARVRGFQGADPARPDRVLACAKHFAAYGGAEGGRDYNTVDVSEQTLREVYLPPFRAAVDAGAGTLMGAFNEISGTPCSANPLILNRILRDEWGFTGFVISDWSSIKELIPHGFAANEADAGRLAILAGVDMEMVSTCYRDHLATAVESGQVPIAVIDESVRRILRAKQRLGLFETPYTAPEREQTVMLSPEHRRTARAVAGRSIVLLKNDAGVLPLRGAIKSIAVIGPLADSPRDALGTWAGRGRPEDVVTPLAGIKARAGAAITVRYAQGCAIESASTDGFAEAVAIAQSSDVVILVVGEGEMHSGEGHSRSTLNLPGMQEDLVKAVHAAGKPTVVALLNGRPLTINWIAEHVPAILETWQLGVEHGNALADVLFGDLNPGGKLPVTFPRSVGQIPMYYYHKNTGRPPTEDRYTSRYIDLPSTPLYPFGWGLSYTRFEISNLRLASERINPRERLHIRVDVKNVGDVAGDEVVQLYVRDNVASMTRPVKQLQGFERITLGPGETRTVRFELSASELGFYDAALNHSAEPGTFDVWVGPNSVEGLQGRFELTP